LDISELGSFGVELGQEGTNSVFGVRWGGGGEVLGSLAEDFLFAGSLGKVAHILLLCISN